MALVKVEPVENDLDGAQGAWKYHCLAVTVDREYDPTASTPADEEQVVRSVKKWLSVNQMEPRMIYQHRDTAQMVEMRPYLHRSRQAMDENVLDMVNDIPRSPFIQRPIRHLEKWPRELYNTLQYRVHGDTSLAFYVHNAGNTNIPAALVWRLLSDIFHAAMLVGESRNFLPGLSPLEIRVVRDDGTFQDGTDRLPHAMLTGLSMKTGVRELDERRLGESIMVLLQYLRSWVIDRAIDGCLQRYPPDGSDLVDLLPDALHHYESLSPEQKLSVNGVGSAIYDEELVDLLQFCTEPSDRLTGGQTTKLARIKEALPKMRRWEGNALEKLHEIPTWVMGKLDQTARVRAFHDLVSHVEHHEQPQLGGSYADRMMDLCERCVAAGLENSLTGGMGRIDSLFAACKSLERDGAY